MTLMATRPFKYLGHPVAKGDVVSPEPTGRLRTALVDAGFAQVVVPTSPPEGTTTAAPARKRAPSKSKAASSGGE